MSKDLILSLEELNKVAVAMLNKKALSVAEEKASLAKKLL
jgi:hypothetical protein